MTTAALAYQKVQKNIKTTIDAVPVFEINWKIFCFAGFFVLLSLLIFYVWQINSLTKGFYAIENYQKQIKLLSQENNNLETVFAENSFLGQTLEKIQALHFQKSTSVKYIQIMDASAQAPQPMANI